MSSDTPTLDQVMVGGTFILTVARLLPTTLQPSGRMPTACMVFGRSHAYWSGCRVPTRFTTPFGLANSWDRA